MEKFEKRWDKITGLIFLKDNVECILTSALLLAQFIRGYYYK